MLLKTQFREAILYVAIAVLTVAVFAADLLTPLGFTGWLLYLISIVLTLFVRQPGAALGVAAIESVMLLIGYFVSPGTGGRFVIFNRLVGDMAIWMVAIVAYSSVSTKSKLLRSAWLQAGQIEIASAIPHESTPVEIANNVLQVISQYTGARMGVLYMVEGLQLRRFARYGLPNNVAPETVNFGVGLIGQCVIESTPLVREKLPPGYITAGSTQVQPSHVMVAPFFANGNSVGVIELFFIGDAGPARKTVDLMARAAETLGMSLKAAQHREHLKLLLHETQHQAEELQVQEEELRVTNEELEERGRALLSSRTYLERQQATLAQTNVQLEEYSQDLERQKNNLFDTQHELTVKAASLERASLYKSEFLANMSHELRTPLNSSLILAKLLQGNKLGNLTPDQVRYAGTIFSSNSDLLLLINDILDLAKIEARQMEVTAEPIALLNVKATLERAFEAVARAKGVALRVECRAALPDSITTDHQRLMQIMRNLLSNAFKFTDHGEVIVRVQSAGSEYVSFVIEDTGIGIGADHLATIFDAFRQADGSTSRKFGGSGLGLSISRELAHLLGGDLEVTSVPGKGSCFTLTIPESYDADKGVRASISRHAGTEPLDVSQSASNGSAVPSNLNSEPHHPSRLDSGSRSDTASRFGNTGLLSPSPEALIDDRHRLRVDRQLLLMMVEESFARVLYALAHELHFDCVIAATGEEGLRLGVELQPNAIMLDIGLPDGSGLTVLERLKRNVQTRHIPVHVISAHDYTNAARELGAIGHTVKTTDRGTLIGAIGQLQALIKETGRSLLVVGNDTALNAILATLTDATRVQTKYVDGLADAAVQVTQKDFDCVVIQAVLLDGAGRVFLRNAVNTTSSIWPPVIVYCNEPLTAQEETKLRTSTKPTIVKIARSPEKLLTEVTLFLHSVEASLSQEQQDMLDQARQTEEAFIGRKILLAEDDVRNIFAMSQIIESLGASLQIVRNGREAIEKLSNDDGFDLVLMDIMMPEMDGLTAMREIRKISTLEHIPIIALTAKAMPSDRESCLAAGANDYISKPIALDRFLSLCRVWLAH